MARTTTGCASPILTQAFGNGKLHLLEASVVLKPSCSFWRLAKREILEDYEKIDEVPRSGNEGILPQKADPTLTREN
jgi:hypothetical protein